MRDLPRSRPCAARSSLGLRRAGQRTPLARLSKFDAARGAPETLKIVIMARAFREHMHDQAAEIEQHPIAACLAFPVHPASANPLQLLFNFITDGFQLRRAESGADHKIIRERSKACEIEEDNIRRLFFLRGAN